MGRSHFPTDNETVVTVEVDELDELDEKSRIEDRHNVDLSVWNDPEPFNGPFSRVAAILDFFEAYLQAIFSVVVHLACQFFLFAWRCLDLRIAYGLEKPRYHNLLVAFAAVGGDQQKNKKIKRDLEAKVRKLQAEKEAWLVQKQGLAGSDATK